mmetsp:Transcript_4935/g.9303  ORF Transcript_4935/g.9303 Transcript_4935/m.9303 type:complete len:268 (+) Transcript_4935:959-1762(+)
MALSKGSSPVGRISREGGQEDRDQLRADAELLLARHEAEHEAIDRGTAGGESCEREGLVAPGSLEARVAGPAVQGADRIHEDLRVEPWVLRLQDASEDALHEVAHLLGGVAQSKQEAEGQGAPELDEVLREQGGQHHGRLPPEQLAPIAQQVGHVRHEAVHQRGVLHADVRECDQGIVAHTQGLCWPQVEHELLHGPLRQRLLAEAELPQSSNCVGPQRHALGSRAHLEGPGGQRLEDGDEAGGHLGGLVPHQRQLPQQQHAALEAA